MTTWTTELPTEPGYYFYRHDNGTAILADFYRDADGDLMSTSSGDAWDIGDHLSSNEGIPTEWLGPFTPADVLRGMALAPLTDAEELSGRVRDQVHNWGDLDGKFVYWSGEDWEKARIWEAEILEGASVVIEQALADTTP